MSRLIAQLFVSAELVPVVVVTTVVNQDIWRALAQALLVQVPSQALAEVLVLPEVDMVEDSLLVVDLLVDPAPPLATSAVDQTTLLEIVKPKQ